MYEMRQKRIKEMKEKKWFNYALLAVAIFLFSQGSSIIKTNMEVALPLILIGFVLHISSVGNLAKRIFKVAPSAVANISMLAALTLITVICYLKPINIIYVILLNFAAIAVYVITATICNKLKQENNE